MKTNIKTIIGSLIIAALAVACATSTVSPGKQIDVFRDGNRPSRDYVELQILRDDARAEEQEEVEAKMIKKARQLGGDAILFGAMEDSGFDVGPFMWGAKKSYLFKGHVLKYQ